MSNQVRRVSMNLMTMRKMRMALAVWLMVACGAPSCLAWGAEKGAADKAANATAGEQALVIEVTVPAPIGQVWKAFTTSEGLSTWLKPNAVVDLRGGGEG